MTILVWVLPELTAGPLFPGVVCSPLTDSLPGFLAEYRIPPSAKLGSPPSDQGPHFLESPEEKIAQDKDIQDLLCLSAFIYGMLGKAT